MQFLEWRSCDWLSKVDARVDMVTLAVHAGLSAYAKKQGSVFHNLATWFCQHWYSTLLSLSLPHAWATEFLTTHGAPLINPDFKKCKQGVQNSNKSGIPVVHSLTKLLPSITTADTLPAPSNIETADNDAQVTSDNSKGSMESDKFTSDSSSSSWVE